MDGGKEMKINDEENSKIVELPSQDEIKAVAKSFEKYSKKE